MESQFPSTGPPIASPGQVTAHSRHSADCALVPCHHVTTRDGLSFFLCQTIHANRGPFLCPSTNCKLQSGPSFLLVNLCFPPRSLVTIPQFPPLNLHLHHHTFLCQTPPNNLITSPSRHSEPISTTIHGNSHPETVFSHSFSYDSQSKSLRGLVYHV